MKLLTLCVGFLLVVLAGCDDAAQTQNKADKASKIAMAKARLENEIKREMNSLVAQADSLSANNSGHQQQNPSLLNDQSPTVTRERVVTATETTVKVSVLPVAGQGSTIRKVVDVMGVNKRLFNKHKEAFNILNSAVDGTARRKRQAAKRASRKSLGKDRLRYTTQPTPEASEETDPNNNEEEIETTTPPMRTKAFTKKPVPAARSKKSHTTEKADEAEDLGADETTTAPPPSDDDNEDEDRTVYQEPELEAEAESTTTRKVLTACERKKATELLKKTKALIASSGKHKRSKRSDQSRSSQRVILRLLKRLETIATQNPSTHMADRLMDIVDEFEGKEPADNLRPNIPENSAMDQRRARAGQLRKRGGTTREVPSESSADRRRK